jgi:hypothetical protein
LEDRFGNAEKDSLQDIRQAPEPKPQKITPEEGGLEKQQVCVYHYR